MKTRLLLVGFLSIFFSNAKAQQLIQGTLKLGTQPNEIEVWLKPNFNNSTQYLFQIGMPIAFPTSASPQPTALIPTLDPGFIAAFGNNYSVTVNPVAQNTASTEKYFNIVLIRGGTGASDPQSWAAGTEFKVLTASFTPSTAPNAQVKLADYQDGGSDGQGNFYTQSGNSDYYVTSNSAGNFYASQGSIVGGGASSGYVQTISAIPHVSCIAPSAPTVNNITTTSADITWNAVSGATGYEYAVTTSSTPPASGTPITTTVSNANGLIGSSQYYAHVRTDCGSGNFSSWVSTPFTTLVPTCVTPSALIVSNIASTSVDINWNTVSGSIGYEYAVITSATPPASGTAIGVTSYTATGLNAGTLYYVYARTDCGGSLFSSWVSSSFTTICPAPSTPVVSNITAGSADINWNVVSGATGYEYALTTSSTPPPSGTPTANTSYTPTGLLPGTTYYIYVRSSCSPGIFSAWATVSFLTTCPATTTPTVNNITTTTADINWTAVTGVDIYQWAVTTSSTPPVSGTAIAYTTTPVPGLSQGIFYYAYVRSKCSSGIFSAWSSTSFTTKCPAPLYITVSNDSNRANIKWGRPFTGLNNYEYVVTTDSIPPSSGTAISDTNYLATGLASFTTYYVYVRSVCSPGVYSSWKRESFTTGCFKPVLFVMGNTAPTSAVIGWNKVKGAINYEYALLNTAAPPTGSLNFTNDTSLHFDNLRTGDKYYLHVRTHCSPISISEWSSLEFHTSGIEVYPNPIQDIATIIVYGLGNASEAISIYDATGRLMNRLQLTNNTVTVDLRKYAAGVYFVRYGNDKKYTTRIIKQ